MDLIYSIKVGRISSIYIIFLLAHLLLVFNLNLIPVLEHDFPFRDVMEILYPSPFLALSNFDGAHYLLIAKGGYGQFQQAFFPLYPLLINIFSKLFSNLLITGLLISWVTLFFGLIFFKKLSAPLLDQQKSFWVILFLLSFPTAFFYLTVYPESLFLFFSSACLYFIYRKNYTAAAIFAVLSSLTKIQGIFLIIPFIFSVLEISGFSFQKIVKQMRINYKKIIFAISPIFGLALYSNYLQVNYGDPLYFYHSQEAFGAERSSQGIILLPQVIFRYIKILTTSQVNFQYWIALLELSVFIIVFSILLFSIFSFWKKKKVGFEFSLYLYSIAVLLLPTLTGTLSSIPRYALISFGFFIALAKIRSTILKAAIAIIFGIIQGVLFIFFIKGYFVS